MDFLEAVKAMKEGKKVRRTNENKELIYKQTEGELSFLTYNNRWCITGCRMHEVEATDWEIFDEDKDWNLAFHGHIHISTATDIKKCRDLILKDITEKCKDTCYMVMDEATNIINKRFGDLK